MPALRFYQRAARPSSSNPATYGGEGALMIEWAKLVLAIPSERENPERKFRLA